MKYEEINERLVFCGSYEKMGAILDLLRSGVPIDYKTWLRIVGENWSGCDNIFAYHKLLKCFLPKEGPVVEMMTADELAAYEALPDTVTIYRGCGKKNKNGASWTLDKNIASKFPFLNRYRVPDPILVTATVDKCHILAVKLGRNESEVITFNAKSGKGISLSPPEGFYSEVTSDDICVDDSNIGIVADAPGVFEVVYGETASATEMVTL